MPGDALVPLTIPPAVTEPASAFMHARTVAFWGHHDVYSKGQPKQYGSGVLLQIADRRFIATAHHVAEMFLDHGCSAFIGAGADKLILLDQASLRHSKKADIALLSLSDNICAALSPEKHFTRLSEVDNYDPTYEAGGIYCALGYPSDASDTDDVAKMHTMVAHHCWGIPLAKTARPISDFDPGMHVAISFDNAAHPHPPGMSGCGIWRVYQAGAPAPGWSTGDIRLVAIFHTLRDQV